MFLGCWLALDTSVLNWSQIFFSFRVCEDVQKNDANIPIKLLVGAMGRAKTIERACA